MILFVFRIIFLLVGVGAGYFFVGEFGKNYLEGNSLLIGQISGLIILGLLGFFLGGLLGKKIIKDITEVEKKVKSIPGNNLLVGTIGLVTGIVVGLLISLALRYLPLAGPFIPIIMVTLFAYVGIILALKSKELILSIFKTGRRAHSDDQEDVEAFNKDNEYFSISKPKIIDTSSIIDARISDIANTGFMEGKLIIPGFVVNELQSIADSSDNLKRIKGRTGLDLLQKIQDNKKFDVKIIENDYPKLSGVDAKLIALAKEINGIIITTDFNLNKVAKLKGIDVLNINDLSNAVKAIIMPGEKMHVEIIKEGKEKDQGVAYLDDGTMIVVESGKTLVGKEVAIAITGILQTPAGRMIFAKIENGNQ